MHEDAIRPAETASERATSALERALILHTFAMMPFEGAGGIFAGGAMNLAVAWLEGGVRYAIWVTLQLVALVTNIGVYGAERTGRFGGDVRRAGVARRIGVMVTGVTWGAGALLFPLGEDLGLGFAIVFCYAGLCAGAAATLAGDPRAYAIFATTTLAPVILVSLVERPWVSVLILGYLVVMAGAAFGNHRALRESLMLRFENDALLRQTIAEREAAEAARADAERAAHAKTTFLAAASHDLRQPVQALSLFVDRLTRDAELSHAERARTITALGRTTDAMRAMIEALLDVSRLDAGVVVESRTTVELAPLLDEVVTALRDEAESYDMVVSTAGPACAVHADPTLLSRVLHNLATNAVRHARRGRVLLATRARGDAVILQVWDQGPGIADADSARIFDEFVQLENPERDRRRGLGLGLPMVKRICALAGWPLRLASRVGRGSTFSVTLPRADLGVDDARPSDVAPRRDALRVLLVEDDALVREAMESALTAHGCDVHVAHDVTTARDALDQASAPFDVLVTDYRLPGEESGEDLVLRVTREGDRALPAVLLTGDVELPLVGAEARAHVVVLRKPVSGDVLRAALDRALRAGLRA